MARNQRDEPQQDAVISDPAACASMTATAGAWADVSAAVVADLAALKTAVDANNTAIDSCIDNLSKTGVIPT